jgi:hypothetical protein
MGLQKSYRVNSFVVLKLPLSSAFIKPRQSRRLKRELNNCAILHYLPLIQVELIVFQNQRMINQA